MLKWRWFVVIASHKDHTVNEQIVDDIFKCNKRGLTVSNTSCIQFNWKIYSDHMRERVVY